MQPTYGKSALIYRWLKVGAGNFLAAEKVHQWIEQQPNSFLAAGFEKPVPRWDQCLNVLGGYIEKWKLLLNVGYDKTILFRQHACLKPTVIISCLLCVKTIPRYAQ